MEHVLFLPRERSYGILPSWVYADPRWVGRGAGLDGAKPVG